MLSGLPVLLGLPARLVTVGLCRADEGLRVGADLADQFLGLPLGLGDPGLGGAHCGVGVGLSPADRLSRLSACLTDGLVGSLADPLDFGVRVRTRLLGLGLRLAGALLGLVARVLSGPEFLVRLYRRGVRFLPAHHLAGGFGPHCLDLPGRLCLHRLYLCGGYLGVGGPLQLCDQVGELSCQRGYVVPDAPAQFGRPRGGHCDRPSQIVGLGDAVQAG